MKYTTATKELSMKNKKLVYGVGLNDVPLSRQKQEKEYRIWQEMLRRCYSSTYQLTHPTYIGCSVEPEWLVFSNFLSWLLEQNYINKCLDKDVLVPGNKIYSKDTCVFISKSLNNFFITRTTNGETLFPGVYKNREKFQAKCSDPFLNKTVYLGTFECAEDAYNAWKAYKHSLAVKYAEQETDQRIVKALQNRYL